MEKALITKYCKIRREKFYQTVIAKTSNCNIQEVQTLAEIIKKHKVTLLFSSLESSPNPLLSRLSFFSHFPHYLYLNMSNICFLFKIHFNFALLKFVLTCSNTALNHISQWKQSHWWELSLKVTIFFKYFSKTLSTYNVQMGKVRTGWKCAG